MARQEKNRKNSSEESTDEDDYFNRPTGHKSCGDGGFQAGWKAKENDILVNELHERIRMLERNNQVELNEKRKEMDQQNDKISKLSDQVAKQQKLINTLQVNNNALITQNGQLVDHVNAIRQTLHENNLLPPTPVKAKKRGAVQQQQPAAAAAAAEVVSPPAPKHQRKNTVEVHTRRQH